MRSSERGTGKEESRKPLRINGYKDFRFLIFVLRALDDDVLWCAAIERTWLGSPFFL